jgi:hypothetical protein
MQPCRASWLAGFWLPDRLKAAVSVHASTIRASGLYEQTEATALAYVIALRALCRQDTRQ